jgi:hypothetical protein
MITDKANCLVAHGNNPCTCPGFNGNPPNPNVTQPHNGDPIMDGFKVHVVGDHTTKESVLADIKKLSIADQTALYYWMKSDLQI